MAAEVRQFFGSRKGLTEAARQARGLVILPPALDSAIRKFLEDYSSSELKKNVSRLSATLRNVQEPGGRRKTLAAQLKPEQSDETVGSEAAREALDEFSKSRPARLHKARGETAAIESMQYTVKNTAAYVAARMPAIYGAVHRVLSELSRRDPDFKPFRLLDFGSGPGTVLWASSTVWPGVVKTAHIVEPCQAMTHAFRSLLTDVQNFPSIKSYPSLLDLAKSVRRGPREHDLVISSYTLGEVPTKEDRIRIVRQLWSFTSDILVLVEPGTPEGSATIREMRAHILQMERKKLRRQKQGPQVSKDGKEEASEDVEREATPATQKSAGAFVVAPCSHDGACPMDGLSTWCHFVQRLQRTSLQRITKRHSAVPLRSYEDEKFSFIILRRGVRTSKPWPLDDLKDEPSHQEPENLEFLELGSSEETFEGMSMEEMSDDALDSDTELLNDTETIDLPQNPEKNEASESHVANMSTGWARIVSPPLRRGGHVLLDVCQSVDRDGSKGTLSRVTWARRTNLGKHVQGKKLMWGDLWPC